MSEEKKMDVPQSLRVWFVIHFAADLIFALPLFFAPEQFLSILGWTEIDPVTTRLVAAALFGIGIQSLLSRNEKRASFKAMLGLKTIWSGSAVAGLIWSAIAGGPTMAWAFAGVFAIFSIVWWYYRLTL